MIYQKVLRQKAKLHWLEVRDKNNRYFHNAIKEKQASNSIREIINHNGEKLTCIEDIKLEAVRHFTKLFTHKPHEFMGAPMEELDLFLRF